MLTYDIIGYQESAVAMTVAMTVLSTGMTPPAKWRHLAGGAYDTMYEIRGLCYNI